MARFSIFNDIKRISRTTRFDDDDIFTIFGDVKVDFTRKPIEPGDHHLNVTTLFGDVQFRFPEHLGLKIDGFSLFGDVEVENLRTGETEQGGADYISENYASADIRVQIHITTIFGDFEILRLPLAPESLAAGAHPTQVEQRGDEWYEYRADRSLDHETSRLPPPER